MKTVGEEIKELSKVLVPKRIVKLKEIAKQAYDSDVSEASTGRYNGQVIKFKYFYGVHGFSKVISEDGFIFVMCYDKNLKETTQEDCEDTVLYQMLISELKKFVDSRLSTLSELRKEMAESLGYKVTIKQ